MSTSLVLQSPPRRCPSSRPLSGAPPRSRLSLPLPLPPLPPPLRLPRLILPPWFILQSQQPQITTLRRAKLLPPLSHPPRLPLPRLRTQPPASRPVPLQHPPLLIPILPLFPRP